MKKMKLFFATIAIALCGMFAFSGIVNADEIDTINFTTDKAIAGGAPITEGATGVDYAIGEITKWFMGGTADDPGQEVTPTKYYKKASYIAQVTFTLSEDYVFSENAEFYMNGEKGYVQNYDPYQKEAVVNFEVPLHFRVQFQTNGGTAIEDQYVKEGDSVIEPADPTKEGNVFYGWFETEECDNWEYNFYDSVYDNITLYALFVPTSKIIKNVNLILTLPKIGTKYTVTTGQDEEYGYVWQQQKPSVTVKSNTSNVSANASIIKGVNNYGMFSGIIQKGKYYYFDVDFYPQNGYVFTKGALSVTINGQKMSKLDYKSDNWANIVYKKVIAKASNPIVVKNTTKTVLYTKVKKAVQVVKPLTVTKNQGKLTYTKLSGSSAKLTINKTTGRVAVKKGTTKGTYKIKIKVSAAGNALYNSGYKIVTAKIIVK